eukprot:scaffold161254_cov32-Tisochrysis_lutea.AAC.4
MRPYLERSETSTELGPKVCWPCSPRSNAPFAPSRIPREVVQQIVRAVVERAQVGVSIANQHTPGVVSYVEPFVKVEGQRVCPVQAR